MTTEFKQVSCPLSFYSNIQYIKYSLDVSTSRTIRILERIPTVSHCHRWLQISLGAALIRRVKDEPGNADDFLFNRVPVDRRHLVLADFIVGGSAAQILNL